MTSILIGLVGLAFSGKDTVAAHLHRQHGFHRMAFADPLKEGLKTLFGLGDWNFTPENKESEIEWIGKSPRELMQTLGTEWGRTLIDRQIWCRHMERRVKPKLSHGRPVVISDLRFFDEHRLVHSHGGQIWKVIRPGAETTYHCDHLSEQEGRRIVADVELINDGTLEQLFEQVDSAYERLLEEIDSRRMA